MNNKKIGILLVHHRLPWPLNNGMDKLRFNLIRTLNTKYYISLIVPIENEVSIEVKRIFEEITDELILIRVDDIYKNKKHFYYKRLFNQISLKIPAYIYNYYSEKFAKKFSGYASSGNYEYINYLSDFSAIYSLSQKSTSNIIIGPMDDCIENACNNMTISSNFKKKIGNWFEYNATKKYYRKICNPKNKLLFHSEDDINRISSKLKFSLSALSIPVATEIEESINSDSIKIEKNSLIFVGGMGAFFNQDAVQYFCSDILPLVKKEIPEVRFFVVGNNPSKDIFKLDDGKSVYIVGEVENVMPYILRSHLYISPIRFGTGIKTKMIEAFKAGKAIVATSLALQGLWQINTRAILVGDTPEKFAQAIIKVLKDDELCSEMSRESFLLYNNYYSFSSVMPETLNIYSKFLNISGSHL